MAVFYEWDVELVANVDHRGEEQEWAADDVIEHFHQTSYRDCLAFIAANPTTENERYDICIVRDDDDGRAWAYVEDGVLAAEFFNAWPAKVCNTPKRFFLEVERARAVA